MDAETGMKVAASMAALALLLCGPQVRAEPSGPVSFAPVSGLPTPLQSISGRFTSLNPGNRHSCSVDQVTGRVVAPDLIMVNELPCGQKETGSLLVNVEFQNPADVSQMVTGRHVTIKARFESAEERRSGPFSAFYLIAENAELVGAEPSAPSAPLTSDMLCQPPVLDALAARLGRDLCVQSTLLDNLSVTEPVLEAAARAPTERISGDPDAITCRPDRERSALHLQAIACARNSYWTWYSDQGRNLSVLTPAPP
jgi:hypothetical protein